MWKDFTAKFATIDAKNAKFDDVDGRTGGIWGGCISFQFYSLSFERIGGDGIGGDKKGRCAPVKINLSFF